jgi:8-hydroxy-5-deazaflavin:NADPH oxidoreductase
VQQVGAGASAGTFFEAAAFGELVFNCTAGATSLAALQSAGAGNLKGKVLIDVSNPLDFTNGMPPTLLVSNTDSLGEQLQRAFPETKVIKTLNTMNCDLMVNPQRLAGGDHDVFVSGNDQRAKAEVTELLRSAFGWKRVIDLGDLSTARGTESFVALWVRLFGALQSADFNVKVVR